MTSSPDPRWRHTFHLSDILPLFRYRCPDLWAADLLDMAGIRQQDTDLTTTPAGDLTVTGGERALRLICVALNRHAEQSPSDPTPSYEAERLEDTFRTRPLDAPLTVRQVAEALFDWMVDHPGNDETPLVIGTPYGDWRIITDVEPPSAMAGRAAVTLEAGDHYDTRFHGTATLGDHADT